MVRRTAGQNLVGYGVAVIAVGAAVVFMFAARPWVEPAGVLLMVGLLPVLVSAMVGGRGAAWLASILVVLAAATLLVSSDGVDSWSRDLALPLLFLGGEGFAIGWLAGRPGRRRADEQGHDGEQEIAGSKRRPVALNDESEERLRAMTGDFKQAQQALQQSERQFRTSFELAAVGKAMIDPATMRFLSVNRKLCELLGREAADLMQRSFADVMHAEERADRSSDFRRLLDAEGPDYVRDIRLVRGNGETIWASVTAALIPDPSDRGQQVIAVIQDITSRTLIEQELKRYRTRLEDLVGERTTALEASHERLRMTERMASLGTLSAGLGHDMGNLLLPVRLRLESMELKGIPASLQEDVQAIGKCADHLQRLANGLRLLSLDPDNAVASTGPTELTTWWQDVESFLKNTLPRNVELERRFEDNLPAVAIPRHRLTQVVFNLVQNAGQAIRPGQPGRVRVWAERSLEPATMRLGVTDDGAGMTSEVKARCMEPFFTSRTRGISTGLGLTQVHGIVQKTGGAIEIDSAPGRGTTFTLTLPVVQPQPSGELDGAPLMRAVVSMADDRARSIVLLILQLFHVKVIEGEPDAAAAGADLWVIDGDVVDVSAAERFLQGHQGKRVLIMGCPPDSLVHPQIVTFEGEPKLGELRFVLRGLIDDMLPSAGQANSDGAHSPKPDHSRSLRR